MLAAYYARWRGRRSRHHGGVVEKFIGDAVVGVFGAPAAHEDDPERAVRAGLRIVEDGGGAEGGRRGARFGCASGSTPARRSSALGARAGSGEGLLAGDVDQHGRADPVGRAGDGVAVGLAHLRGDRAWCSTTRSWSPRR